MKKYLRHNFGRLYRSGRTRISLLQDHTQDIRCSSNFVAPLKSIISGYIPNHYYTSRVAIEQQTNEKEQKKSGWLDNLIWNHNPVNILKGDTLEKDNVPFIDVSNAFKLGSHLKKYFSACKFFDTNCIVSNTDKEMNAESIGPINCEDTSKQLALNTTCFHNRSFLDCKVSRSHSNTYLRNNFLRPKKEIYDNSSRSFTTLRPKSESSKLINSEPTNVLGKLQRSRGNIGLMANSKQLASKAIERDPAIIGYEKPKTRDFDWINSFSSEAVILQPSRGEFSIKKLINKTTCHERTWGLPPRQYYARTLGPGMNDNLIQYTVLRHKMQSELRKNNLNDELSTDEQVKKLIKSAKEKNRRTELQKTKKNSSKFTARNMIKTIKQSMKLKPIDFLKTKEKTDRITETKHLQKVQKKSSILNFRLPKLRVKEQQMKVLQKETPKNKPVTEYQSSASYKHVFQELFDKTSRTKLQPKPALPVFNRQLGSQHYSRSATKVSSLDLLRKEKELKKEKSSLSMLERDRTVNLKKQARTIFQQPSNTQLTGKSKASFSTVSEIQKMTGPPAVGRPKLLKNTMNIYTPRIKHSKRSISTNQVENGRNKTVVKKTVYSSLGYYPAVPRRIETKAKKLIKKKNAICLDINENKKENTCQTQSTKSNSGYFNQRRSLSSFGVPIESITNKEESAHSLIEPLLDEVFEEVMSLCKAPPKTEKKTQNSEKEKLLKRYGRCSLKEKKKPERRGFVCRLASMLNIGCGRRRRVSQGCPECGKKSG